MLELHIDTTSDTGDEDVLARLRRTTAARHELLDGGLAIGRDDASLVDYQRHLLMLQAWLTPLESWQARFHDGPQASPALPPIDRLARIAQDLEHPSMPATKPQVAAPVAWPIDASAAYRWGVSYVVEGSQLGGAVLYQRLHARLAPHPLTYLRGEAAGPGARWRAFMLALREAVRGEEAAAQACRGACDAFDRILALRPMA